MTTLYRITRYLITRSLFGYRPLWQPGVRLNIWLLRRYAGWRAAQKRVIEEDNASFQKPQ